MNWLENLFEGKPRRVPFRRRRYIPDFKSENSLTKEEMQHIGSLGSTEQKLDICKNALQDISLDYYPLETTAEEMLDYWYNTAIRYRNIAVKALKDIEK